MNIDNIKKYILPGKVIITPYGNLSRILKTYVTRLLNKQASKKKEILKAYKSTVSK